MDDKILQQFRRIISRKTGILVRTEDLAVLRKVITTRVGLLSLSGLEDYLCLLSNDTYEGRCEWKELVIPLTIGESFFFRDKGLFAVLKGKIIPELIEKKKDVRYLRIWSAGCSSGEEPYSLAILLDGLLPDRRNWQISITGTDINENVLEQARQGKYSQWSFRMVDPEIQGRYFRKHKDGWAIDDRVKNMVTFSYGNLIEEAFPDSVICSMDLILCRNVFIYFNSDAISAVTEKFIKTLTEGGYLMTGHGDLHMHGYPGLKARIFPESVIYQKVMEQPDLEINIESRIQKPEFRIPETTGIPSGGVHTEIRILKSEFEQAQEYADRGEYKKAEESCKMALKKEPYSARCYYLLSQVYEAMGRGGEATESLKKAIYLEPSFVAAYLELGSNYDKQGETSRAKKMRETAADLLAKMPQDALVEPYKDINAGELLEYVRKIISDK